MKKVLFSFFIILFLPLNIFAYSKNIIPGGESIGIKINTDGLVVVGYYKVNGEYIGKDYIKIGDIIKEVNGESVESINELSKIINEEKAYDTLVIRNNKEVNTKLVVLEERSNLKTGLYVKDSITFRIWRYRELGGFDCYDNTLLSQTDFYKELKADMKKYGYSMSLGKSILFHSKNPTLRRFVIHFRHGIANIKKYVRSHSKD